MADLFDELRRKAAEADSSLRERLADHLKGLCQELGQFSTASGSAVKVAALKRDQAKKATEALAQEQRDFDNLIDGRGDEALPEIEVDPDAEADGEDS